MHDGLVDHVLPLALGGLLVAAISWRGSGRLRLNGPARRGVRWARAQDLRRLLVRPGPLPAGRLVLGQPCGPTAGRHVLATEDAQSVVVVGPTQSGKTSCLALPALIGWDGPAVAASVKSDLLRHSMAERSQRGQVWCIDPTSATGLPASQWSPLSDCTEWTRACRMAIDLADAAKVEATTADGEFWYATAAKLLAPLFFAAARDGCNMADVVRWVDTQEVGEVADALEQVGQTEALDAARATWCRDERTRSSVYTTAETVLAPFATSPGTGDFFEPAQLLRGRHTLYICAPAHDQRRLRGYFSALVQQVLGHAFATATRAGRALDPPLLVVLDEAAHIAPLAELDGLAATCASHGIQLVTIWQDLAQVRARYGARAPTVLNNHRAKLFLPGIADPDTLEYASALIGETDMTQASVTRDGRGTHSTTSTSTPRRLLTPAELRCLPRGQAVLVYGTLPPARLRLRPYWAGRNRSASGSGPLRAPARGGGRRWWPGPGPGSGSSGRSG
jgi:type IV secretion system protein VirD4